jgi:hypothetical protein
LRFIHNRVITGIPWMVSLLPPHPTPMWYPAGIWQVPTGKKKIKSGRAFPKIEHPPHNNETQSILENRTPSIQRCRKHSRKQNALHIMVQRAFHFFEMPCCHILLYKITSKYTLLKKNWKGGITPWRFPFT